MRSASERTESEKVFQRRSQTKLPFELQQLAIRDAKTDRHGTKTKNRPEKSDMTIYLIYLHNGQDRFGMGRENNSAVLPQSVTVYLRNRC